MSASFSSSFSGAVGGFSVDTGDLPRQGGVSGYQPQYASHGEEGRERRRLEREAEQALLQAPLGARGVIEQVAKDGGDRAALRQAFDALLGDELEFQEAYFDLLETLQRLALEIEEERYRELEAFARQALLKARLEEELMIVLVATALVQ